MGNATTNLGAMNADTDPEVTVQLMISMLKYQLAIDMMKRGEYITAGPTELPTSRPEGFDPMILLSAANVSGSPVSVLVPIRVTQGSELNALMRFSGDLAHARIQAIVSSCNILPLETRQARVAEMLRAREVYEELVAAQQRGEITAGEFAQRSREWSAKLPPRGTFVIRESNTLGM
jgi:hypothetical protein